MAENSLDKDLKEMQKAIHKGAMFVVANSKDISALEKWQVRQNGTLDEIKVCLKNIEEKINVMQSEDIANLRLEAAQGKPTWAVAFILAGMASLTVGAIIIILRIGTGI